MKGTDVETEAGTWYYHADHLGSSSVVTDRDGEFYEQIEYFPYGETWVHNKSSEEMTGVPYKFTGHEKDPETSLYYAGARYYDARLARWVSVDPPLVTGEYLPKAPWTKEDRKYNNNLPGMGGVFNPTNLNGHQYGGLSPIVLVDPDGNTVITFTKKAEVSGGAGGQAYSGIALQFGKGVKTKVFSFSGANLTAGIRADAGFDVNIYFVDTIADMQKAGFITLSGDIKLAGFGAGISKDGKNSLMMNFSFGQGMGISFSLPTGTKNPAKAMKSLQKKYEGLVNNINNSKSTMSKIKNYINLFENLAKDGFSQVGHHDHRKNNSNFGK
jgi:RHS repeat-associated protein